MSSYFLMDINNLGARAMSSEFKVFDLCGDVHFIKCLGNYRGDLCPHIFS